MADLNQQLQAYLARSKAEAPAEGRPEGRPEAIAEAPWGCVGRLRGVPCPEGPGRRERLWASGLCLSLAAPCFGLSLLYLPVLALRARKFALLWSLGSLLCVCAWALWRGPGCPGRAWALYLFGVSVSLYGGLAVRSGPLTGLGAAAQLAALAAALRAALPAWPGAPALRYALGGLAPALPV
ncbi:vesicle transport protein SFT2C [Tachyglossus aculeatus]|uniref:vesicle transport protein SFT2C n=1 Tax=Tachyglossus aculeatus TaxID=9261 RepID=UPI0018F552EC|nr:vesicle transport protein SFT2C [Tachyglossus aculeatus]